MYVFSLNRFIEIDVYSVTITNETDSQIEAVVEYAGPEAGQEETLKLVIAPHGKETAPEKQVNMGLSYYYYFFSCI